MTSPEGRHGAKRPASPNEVSKIIKTLNQSECGCINYFDKSTVVLASLLIKWIIVKSELTFSLFSFLH